jgi:hypothetical protein
MFTQHPGNGAAAAGCEAQVGQVEGGVPLPEMTLAESIAHLTSVAVAGNGRTPAEREVARGLVLRLASLGWLPDAAACRSA